MLNIFLTIILSTKLTYNTKFLWVFLKCPNLLIKNMRLSFQNIQGTVQEARRYSVHNHWESLLQPSRSVECGRSWGHHKSAGEGWQEAAQLDKFEAKLGWEMGD